MLVFSARWNREHTWRRPIVLVGHSLGCVIIEHLVVALEKKTQSIQTLSKDESTENSQAKGAHAFLTSLAGCFFYAPPWEGLVSNEHILKGVFKGLSYSQGLFSNLSYDSTNAHDSVLKVLSQDFMRVKSNYHMKLMAVMEGYDTFGISTVVPPESMQGFPGGVVKLEESNHIDVCKPTHKKHLAYTKLVDFVTGILESPKEVVVVEREELMEYVSNDSNHCEGYKRASKDHRSYKEFLDFISTTLQNQGSSNLNSYNKTSKSCKDNDSDKDESFIIVEKPIASFCANPLSSRKPEDPILLVPQLSRKLEDPNIVLDENKELYEIVKQKINEIGNVAQMQEVEAINFITGESEVVIICNHDDEDDTLVFHFLDGQSMAKVVGVGLDYAKVILQNGVDIHVKEIMKSEWESAWSHSKSMKNTHYETMKVKVPMQNDIKPTSAVNQVDHSDTVMARPLLWDVAKYFMLQRTVATLSNSDAGGGEQSRKNGQGSGSGSGNSNDRASTKALFLHAFRSWFSMQFIKRGDQKDDDDDGNGNDGQIVHKKVDDNGLRANVKVDLLAGEYSFKKCYSEDYGVQIIDKSEDLEIKWDLDFDFFRSKEGTKKISLTMAHIRFGLDEDPTNSQDELTTNRYGVFHDELRVSFSVIKPAIIGISIDVKPLDCKEGKILHVEGSGSLKGKVKEIGAAMSSGGGFGGVLLNGGVSIKHTNNVETSHSTSITSEHNSTFTEGGFNVQDVSKIQQGSMGFKFLAPSITIKDPSLFWSSRDYRNGKMLLPPFQGQKVKFSGSWEPRSDEKVAKYQVKALRVFGEIMRTEVPVASTRSWKLFSNPFASSKAKEVKVTYDYKKLVYEQVYEKVLYLNHEMTHWDSYRLTEKGGRLVTSKDNLCPLVY